MKFLQPQFEGAISPFVDGDRVRVGRYEYTGVDILTLAGPEAYKQAFGDWLWEEWVPARRERKEELLRLESNQGRFDDLKKMMETGRAVPFVGSGMSCPTGLPTWAEFLRNARRRAKNLSPDELDSLLEAGEFEMAASQIFGAMPPRLFNECFERNFSIARGQVIGGAVRLLPSLFQSNVITTNFDEVLEDVYTAQDLPFPCILHGMGVGDFRKRNVDGSRCLLKLHGNRRESHGRVLLKKEYDAFYKKSAAGREELAHVFRQGGLVFFGCSLFHDRTMRLLKDVADVDKNMPKHYAFLKIPDSPGKLVEREHFLTDRNIFPIWYDIDHDADIEALLVGMMDELRKL